MESAYSAADDIASAITKILIQAFTQKEGRDPTNEEVQMLLEELTEERIESMLNGLDEPAAEEKEIESDKESDEDNKSDAEDGEEEVEAVVSAAKDCCESLKRPLASEETKRDENGSDSEQNKKVRVSETEESDENHIV